MRQLSITRLEASAGETVSAYLSSVNNDFPIPLTQKVDLAEYAAKVLSRGIALAMFDGCEIVGLAAGYVNDVTGLSAYLSVLSVSKEYRGRGLGSALVRAFEREAVSSGMERLMLDTHESNVAACSLYEGMGYRTDGARDEVGNLEYSKRLVWLTPDKPNILLSSAGRRTYLVDWLRDALGGIGEVHASNSDSFGAALMAADKGVVSPLIYSDEYIPFMLDYCSRERIGAIVPLFDVDVPVLAAHRAEFEAIGCFPVVAPVDFAKSCSDKLATSKLLAAAGIPCPATYVGAQGFLEAAGCGETSFPAFIKPRWGMGSIGLAEASNEKELDVLCGIVERKVRRSYLRYESSSDAPSRGIVVQPRLDATEYGMDVYCDLSGQYRGCVVRKKVAMRAGETDIAEVVDADPRFERLARTIARLSRHPGCMDVDIFDVDGELMVLEMNARFGGGYPFSHAAGVDMPRALVSWLRGEECDPDALTVKWPGTYMKDMAIVKSGN